MYQPLFKQPDFRSNYIFNEGVIRQRWQDVIDTSKQNITRSIIMINRPNAIPLIFAAVTVDQLFPSPGFFFVFSTCYLKTKRKGNIYFQFTCYLFRRRKIILIIINFLVNGNYHRENRERNKPNVEDFLGVYLERNEAWLFLYQSLFNFKRNILMHSSVLTSTNK